jgi:hypothetical protein
MMMKVLVSLGLPSCKPNRANTKLPSSATSHTTYESDDITVPVGLDIPVQNYFLHTIKHEEMVGSCKAQYVELDSLAECS